MRQQTLIVNHWPAERLLTMSGPFTGDVGQGRNSSFNHSSILSKLQKRTFLKILPVSTQSLLSAPRKIPCQFSSTKYFRYFCLFSVKFLATYTLLYVCSSLLTAPLKIPCQFISTMYVCSSLLSDLRKIPCNIYALIGMFVTFACSS